MQELKSKYPVVVTQEVIWGDMDAFAHVNNTVYFRYFEDARLDYFHRAGVLQHMREVGVGPILASTRCDFRAPLSYPDRVHIVTSVTEMAAKRFTMVYRVFSESSSRLVAEGEGLVVYFDYQKSKSCEIPDLIRQAIEGLEKRYRDE